MTEEPKETEKNDDALVHVAEAAGMISTIITFVGFIFPAARIWSVGVGAASAVLKYFSKGKKHE